MNEVPQPVQRTATLYNDNDLKVAAWLRELIRAGYLPEGNVDDRSIKDFTANDCQPTSHFFAGIGGWAYALQLAGWPANADVWTGSCPCQPLSCAGKRKGEQDSRHLWPALYRLISECRPPVVFGEQVASHDGREWLAGVRADMEALGYRFAAADLCAASAGAPHIRQRLYWVADTGHEQAGWAADTREKTSGRAFRDTSGCGIGLADSTSGQDNAPAEAGFHSELGSSSGGLGITAEPGLEGQPECECAGERLPASAGSRVDYPAGDGAGCGGTSEQGGDRTNNGLPWQTGPGMADAESIGWGVHESADVWEASGEVHPSTNSGNGCGRNLRHWSDSALVYCADGKARRAKSGLQLLAHGVPARVVRLRGYGNSIVPQVAATFVRA